MAWRIEEFLIRGEIDNRMRGRTTGRLWFVGRDEPVELDLAGDAWRDVAGRRLVFRNHQPKPGLPPTFARHQTGAVGDITASRKVKVPEIPLEQIGEYCAARKPFPWHWGNALYLEWLSAANGRVVIESADYELTIEGDAAWEMSPAEEEAQRRANQEAIMRFMERLGGTVAAPDQPRAEDEEVFDHLLEDSDMISDRVWARMERAGTDADLAKILEEELERWWHERHRTPPAPDPADRRNEWINEPNRAAEETTHDPELEAESDRGHPLAEKTFELAVRIHQEVKQRGWEPGNSGAEHPVVELVAGVMKASAKMAGALSGGDYPPPVDDCGPAVARLKRAADYLADAQLAVETCAEQNLTAPDWLAEVRRELAALAAEIDAIIGELRERLQRGFD